MAGRSAYGTVTPRNARGRPARGRVMQTTHKQRGGRGRKRSRKGAATGLWGVVSLTLGIAALLVQGMLLIVLAILSTLLTVLVGYLEYQSQKREVHEANQETLKEAQNGGGSGSGGRRAPRSGAHPPGGSSGAGAAAGKRSRKCDARCRKSVKPVDTCECSCNGTSHGSEATGGPTAKKKTPERKRAPA